MIIVKCTDNTRINPILRGIDKEFPDEFLDAILAKGQDYANATQFKVRVYSKKDGSYISNLVQEFEPKETAKDYVGGKLTEAEVDAYGYLHINLLKQSACRKWEAIANLETWHCSMFGYIGDKKSPPRRANDFGLTIFDDYPDNEPTRANLIKLIEMCSQAMAWINYYMP